LHLLLLAQCFILNSRPGSSANPFLHRPFPLLPDWLHGLSERFYSAQRLYWTKPTRGFWMHCTFMSFHFTAVPKDLY